MKSKYIYLVLAIIATCFLACKNDDESNPIQTTKKHVHAYDYGNSDSFHEFYNQIYAITDMMLEDDDLFALVDDFEYDWEDEEDENYNKYDEHFEYYTNLANSVVLTSTFQTLDDVIDQFMGRPIDGLEGDYDGHFAYMYSMMQESGYVTDSTLYSMLNIASVSEAEIPLLCTAFAFYNHMMEENVICQLILDDGVMRYPYGFLRYAYPQYNSPLVIWTAEVNNLDYVFNNIDSIPNWVKQNALIRDSICFADFESLKTYLILEATIGNLEITVMECQENWQRDRDEASQQYARELQNITQSQLSSEQKQAMLIIATTQLKVKKDLADRNYELCKRAANNENSN